MNLVQQSLEHCALFAGLTPAERSVISEQYTISTRRYYRGEVVAFEEDPCEAMGIVAGGSIHIQRIFPSGKLVTIETFSTWDSFGEALVFSRSNTYPATLIAKEDSEVLFIPRAEVIRLCSRYPLFLENFMRGLSNRILMLNSKIKNLSYATIRQKVASYLLEERRRQSVDKLVLSCSRSELADLLGIPRPSLSRELIAMQAEGWIAFNRREITILDRSAIEQALNR